MSEKSDFFAILFRMKHINRWGLMRSVRTENIAEHSLETAVLAHALAVIGNVYFEKNYDIGHIAVCALYHDATEIFTGDLPTPVKYATPEIKNAFKHIELSAARSLMERLPEDLRPFYAVPVSEALAPDEYKILKAADKLSAYIKCMDEKRAGNNEFSTALDSLDKTLSEMECPELTCFCEKFLPAFEKNLDELDIFK